MINFIIYEEDKEYVEKYQRIIHKFMGQSNDCYKIYKYYEYNQRLKNSIENPTGYNVYLLDIEVHGKSGLDVASEIRMKADFKHNQIIIITSNTDLIKSIYHRKILMMDFLSKYEDLEHNLLECFKEIYKIFSSDKALAIKCGGEIIRIPHDDILYIEKDKSNDYLFIHTEHDEFRYKSNIIDMENTLKHDMRFIKCHRSVIVNVNKIKKVDMVNNVIYFKNKHTNYLARDRKKDLENQIRIIGELI